MKNVLRLQTLVESIVSPRWPSEVLGAIDEAKAKRGEAIYKERRFLASDGKRYTCVECHRSWHSRLYDLRLVGTDRVRALNFLKDLDGMPMAKKIERSIPPIIEATFKAEKVALAPQRKDDWRATGKYAARRLDGVWATAPYLHNGSVPTLYHLLLPAEERPKTFHLGHRSYDPVQVGYETSVENPVFVYKSDSKGGSRSGHEFGTELSEEERWALIEYLKTL